MSEYIYAARIGDKIKVGYSVCPGVRIGLLKSQHKCWVDLIGVVEATEREERAFHRENASYAIASEIYPASAPPVIALIQRLSPAPHRENLEARPRNPRKWFPPSAASLSPSPLEGAAA